MKRPAPQPAALPPAGALIRRSLAPLKLTHPDKTPPSRAAKHAAGRFFPTEPRSEEERAENQHAQPHRRVLVVDDHPMVEEWIATVLEGEAELIITGRAAALADAVHLVARRQPSIVLLELGQDVPRGLETVQALKEQFPTLRLLIFSSCDERANSLSALQAGAHGFVSKKASGHELLRAIRHVLTEGIYLSNEMIRHVVAHMPSVTPVPAHGPETILSERELQVFSLVGDGVRPKEIAQQMSLSVKTVECYLARVREKLSLRDARALFQEAVRWTKLHDRATA